MDRLDAPKCCPVVDGRSFRYSVGFYRNRTRFVSAWFVDYDAALSYLVRMRRFHPSLKVDLLQTLF